jgi:hypothetical protein
MNWKIVLATIYTVLVLVCAAPIVFVRQVWFFSGMIDEDVREWMKNTYEEWTK